MILGIPTLNRYDLLATLIASAESGTVKPTLYFIIDNGGTLDQEHIRSVAGDTPVEFFVPGKNIGVAPAWNLMLERAGAEAIIISNDDIEFQPNTFERMCVDLETNDFVGDGWSLFGQTPECTRRVGVYDENFWPGYYEDTDYDWRLRLAGVEQLRGGASRDVKHESWATVKAMGNPLWMQEERESNYTYFIAKWGSDNPRWGGKDPSLLYTSPFNGKPPPGWSNTTNIRDIIAPMRWDVLNHIAETIGAERYLEIGVADGSCMRRINVKEKWGVDPTPQDGAVKAASVFVPRTSDFFFERLASTSGLFDLVFIDGDHRAEQVYREVQSAIKILSPKGVICLHDCNPHSEEMQEVPLRTGYQWTGDVWKAIARLRSEGEHRVRVIPSDYGVGVVLPARGRTVKAYPLPYQAPLKFLEPDRLLWRDLVADRENLLGLIPPGTWQEYLKSALD